MRDNHEVTMLQILKDLVKGQNEASQRHVETTRFQQQILEVLTQLVGQCGNTSGAGQGGSSGSHWGDMTHTESRNNHTPAQSRSLRIPWPLLPQFLTGQPTRAQEQPDQGLDINTSYMEYETIDEDIREKVSCNDFCDLKQKYRPREWNRGAQSQ